MNFDFPRIYEPKLETSVEYLQRHFLYHSAFFFLEQTTDRQIDLLFWVLRYPVHRKNFQNKLHPKHTPFSCFLIICSSAIWKSLFSRNRSYLRHSWYLEGNWLNVIPSFCWQILLCADYSLIYFMKV